MTKLGQHLFTRRQKDKLNKERQQQNLPENKNEKTVGFNHPLFLFVLTTPVQNLIHIVLEYVVYTFNKMEGNFRSSKHPRNIGNIFLHHRID